MRLSIIHMKNYSRFVLMCYVWQSLHWDNAMELSVLLCSDTQLKEMSCCESHEGYSAIYTQSLTAKGALTLDECPEIM